MLEKRVHRSKILTTLQVGAWLAGWLAKLAGWLFLNAERLASSNIRKLHVQIRIKDFVNICRRLKDSKSNDDSFL